MTVEQRERAIADSLAGLDRRIAAAEAECRADPGDIEKAIRLVIIRGIRDNVTRNCERAIADL